MVFSIMEISSLKAFLAVAETGSFSRASEQLYLTQPAVSKRVATLENELGTRLFDRIGRQVTLTESGKQLMPRAHRLILEMDDIRRAISNLTDRISGKLIMATSHHIGLHRLPPALKEYSRAYPQVKLDIRFMDSENACNAVEHGELELGIVTLPPTPISNLKLTRIWHDPLSVVVSADHPLARLEQCSLDDLCRYPAVLAARGTYTREILEQALNEMGLSIQIGMATNYLETLKMMASIGLGWSLLPQRMVQNSSLQILAVDQLRLSRELGAVVHCSRTLSNAAQAMLNACFKQMD